MKSKLAAWLLRRANRLGPKPVAVSTHAPAVAGEQTLFVNDRILLVVRDAHGLVIATERALYHQDGAAADGWGRIGWEQVGSVEYDGDHGVLALTGLHPDAPRRTELRPVGASALSELVDLSRERVAACTLATARVRLGDRRQALVSARRAPGSDRLQWAVIVDPGIDPRDARTIEEVDDAIADLRADLGV